MVDHLKQPFETPYHAPVMVREVLDALSGCHTVLDCTLGGGGHTMALLEHGVPLVIGIDRDPDAIAEARRRCMQYERAGRFQAVQGDFTHVDTIVALEGLTFDGILADLGVSSHQIDEDARGFSFRPGVPLDMRMTHDRHLASQTAAEWLNETDEATMAAAFREYGDEPRARRLAAEVVRRRATRPFVISDDLVGAIRAVLGPRSGASDFARLFQAVRIAVNDEMAGLARALPLLRDRLTAGGVLAIIAYHSGEDRRVKQAMRDWSTACHCPPKQPMCTCGGVALGTTLTRKARIPTADEAATNPRARSAKFRVWQKAA